MFFGKMIVNFEFLGPKSVLGLNITDQMSIKSSELTSFLKLSKFWYSGEKGRRGRSMGKKGVPA